jgi:hypothetical protein
MASITMWFLQEPHGVISHKTPFFTSILLILCHNVCLAYQSRKYSLFTGRVMVGVSGEIEIGMHGLAVYLVTQKAIRSPVNVYVESVGVNFYLQCPW